MLKSPEWLASCIQTGFSLKFQAAYPHIKSVHCNVVNPPLHSTSENVEVHLK